MVVEQESLEGTLDRRSALKQAAAAGVIVWTVPTLLSSKVSADHVCTLKCAPSGTATVSLNGTGVKGGCVTGSPPGGELRKFTVTNVSIGVGSTVSCPCGGSGGSSPTVIFSATDLIYFDTQNDQGVRKDVVVGQVSVTLRCFDRRNRPVDSTCVFDVVATFQGSCAGTGNANQNFTLRSTGSCSQVCAA